MPINHGSIGTKSITTNHRVVIDMLTDRPTYGLAIPDGVKRAPGQICGFYNGTTQKVELYVVDSDGHKAVKVG